MPIPDFDHNYVLPPHVGNPVYPEHVSPYSATITELVQHFGTSTERRKILKGLLAFRAGINNCGLINGYQWLDGSFMENIEIQENRPPNDLDLLTIYWGYKIDFQEILAQRLPAFFDSKISKDIYHLDHYPVDASYHPEMTVEAIRYWAQLFTHNRNRIWKGMVRIDLNTPTKDNEALQILENA